MLYPPLTYLKPTGKTDTVSAERDGQQYCFTIVEVEPVLS